MHEEKELLQLIVHQFASPSCHLAMTLVQVEETERSRTGDKVHAVGRIK